MGSGRDRVRGIRMSEANKRAPRGRLLVLIVLLLSVALSLSDSGEPRREKSLAMKQIEELKQILPKEGSAYKIKLLPRLVGEKIQFECGWQGIHGATARLYVDEVDRNGKRYLRIRGRASTSKAIDPLWKMRDWGESLVDPESLLCERYTFESRENKRHRITEVVFDLAQGVANYTKHKLDRKKVRRKVLPIRAALDPFAAGYFVRGLEFSPESPQVIEVLSGDDIYLVTLYYLGKEKIKVKAGTFQAIKLRPLIVKVKRNEVKLDDATVWLSDDELHIPLKFTSRVWVGEVYGELVKYEAPASFDAQH